MRSNVWLRFVAIFFVVAIGASCTSTGRSGGGSVPAPAAPIVVHVDNPTNQKLNAGVTIANSSADVEGAAREENVFSGAMFSETSQPTDHSSDETSPASASPPKTAHSTESQPQSDRGSLVLFPIPSRWQTPAFLDDAVGSSSQPQSKPAGGTESGASAEAAEDADLQKKTLNPVSDLISVPFQYNADFNIGPKNATRSLLNIQPVIPVSISEDFNLILRTIVPVIYTDSVANRISSKFGLGDTVQSFFLAPKAAIGGWILGAGPVMLYPTATNDALGSGKWGAGPTGVALRQDGPWTYGVLANQIWSFAGDENRRSVNSMFAQPFIGYSFPTFTSIVLNTETTYDWRSHQTVIPINLFVTQILKVGNLPINLQLGPRYYAERAPGGPLWGVRFGVVLLLPK